MVTAPTLQFKGLLYCKWGAGWMIAGHHDEAHDPGVLLGRVQHRRSAPYLSTASTGVNTRHRWSGHSFKTNCRSASTLRPRHWRYEPEAGSRGSSGWTTADGLPDRGGPLHKESPRSTALMTGREPSPCRPGTHRPSGRATFVAPWRAYSPSQLSRGDKVLIVLTQAAVLT